jgi:ribosomal-protein-alanine N-acetyltransferase
MTQQRDIGGAISAASPFVPARDTEVVTIAPARLRDLRAMAHLQRRAFRPALAYGLGTLLFLWLVPRVRCLVARDEHGIVGCAIGDRHDGDGRVISLCVDPDARRRGIGTRLLRELEAALPMGNVLLMVEQDNTAAQSLYRREGYTAVGVARDYYGRGHHGVWMQKQRMPEATRKLWF